jgi:hypothetical protein
VKTKQEREEEARRVQALVTIESTYPPDSVDEKTREVGQKLLGEAIMNAGVNWRDTSTEIIVEFARLCKAEE